MNKAAKELRESLKRMGMIQSEASKRLLRLLSAALKEERARCAKVAVAHEHVGDYYDDCDCAKEIANAIRQEKWWRELKAAIRKKG